jgi:hypothetical protein
VAILRKLQTWEATIAEITAEIDALMMPCNGLIGTDNMTSVTLRWAL